MPMLVETDAREGIGISATRTAEISKRPAQHALNSRRHEMKNVKLAYKDSRPARAAIPPTRSAFASRATPEHEYLRWSR